MKATFVRSQKQTPALQTFYFRPEHQLRYIAGQFIELRLDTDTPKGTSQEQRWFTLSSSPTEKLLAITTDIEGHHRSEFKSSLRALQPGARVTISEAMGDFVLPKDQAQPLLFVAGGIGITPYISMLRWLSDNDQQRDIQLIYATKQPSDQAFSPLLSASGIAVTRIFGKTFRSQDIYAHSPDFAQRIVYLSGPEPMIEHLVAEIAKHHIKPVQIITDYFPGYSGL